LASFNNSSNGFFYRQVTHQAYYSLHTCVMNYSEAYKFQIIEKSIGHPLIGSTIIICSFWFPLHINGLLVVIILWVLLLWFLDFLISKTNSSWDVSFNFY